MPNQHHETKSMNLFKNLFGASETENKTSNVGWKRLTNVDQLQEVIKESAEKPVAIFKHSTRCGISRMVLKQFEAEYDLDDLVTPYFVDLLENREVSNEIANQLGIAHQSPQLLLVRNGKTIYDASHGDIYADDLKRYI